MCKAPTGIANAANTSCREGATVAPGSACTPVCTAGFVPSNASLACAETWGLSKMAALTPSNFTCVGVPCSALAAPPRGSVNVTNGGRYPSTATYTCQSGSGGGTRACGTDGKWNGTAPTCGAQCPLCPSLCKAVAAAPALDHMPGASRRAQTSGTQAKS